MVLLLFESENVLENIQKIAVDSFKFCYTL